MEHSRPEFIVLDEFAKLLREVAELRHENGRLKETIYDMDSRPKVSKVKEDVIFKEKDYGVVESSLFAAAPDLLSSLEATCRILQFDLIYFLNGTEWRFKTDRSCELRKDAVDKAVAAIRKAYGIGLERFVPVSEAKSVDPLVSLAPEMYSVLCSVLERLVILSESRLKEHGSSWYGYAWYPESFDKCICDIRAVVEKVKRD